MDRKVSVSLRLLQKRHGDFYALEVAKKIGADGLDFSFSKEDYRKPDSIYAKSHSEFIAHYSALRTKAQELGIAISQAHGRYEICFDDPEHTEDAMKNARLDCMAAHYMGCPYVVFHGVNKPFDGTEAAAEKFRMENDTLFGRILGFAREFGIKVAMETDGPDAFFGSLKEYEASFKRISRQAEDQSFLIACVDTGHTNKSVGYDGNPSVGDTIRRLGKKVACLHMHDNNGISDQHRAPFSGSIDWADVFDALDEIGYTGWYNLEPNLNLLKSFGKGFEVEYAAFAVKILRFMLESRYGKE